MGEGVGEIATFWARCWVQVAIITKFSSKKKLGLFFCQRVRSYTFSLLQSISSSRKGCFVLIGTNKIVRS